MTENHDGSYARAMRTLSLVLLLVSPALAAESGVDDSAARDLLARWLGAQNAGNASDYNALYAERFFGIKRSGPRTYRFDRAGWIRDRGRMFRRTMRVEAGEVTVSTDGRAAVVRFVQTWASGTYKDVGPKQLVIVRDKGAVRIAREEMLGSTKAGAATAKTLDPARFAFVLDTHHLVLDDDARGEWTTQPPRLLSRDPYVAVAPTNDKLPAPWRAWLGKAVTRFDAGGDPCSGKVAELVVLTGFDPHFGSRGYWEGHPNFNDDAKPLSAEKVAEEVWRGGATHWLVARIEGEACPGALWGRPAETGAPPKPSVSKTKLEAAALSRFRALKGYRAVQKLFGDEGGKKQTRWELFEGMKPRLSSFAFGSRRYVAVSGESGHGCGGFYGSFWALFGTTADGKLQLLTDPNDPGELFHPTAIIDSDGEPEFLSPGRLVRPVGPVFMPTDEARYPSFDCPC